MLEGDQQEAAVAVQNRNRYLIATAALSACSQQPQHSVLATVVSISQHANPKWNAEELVLTARSPDGTLGTKSIVAARLNCRVGDTVRAKEQGVALAIDDHACQR